MSNVGEKFTYGVHGGLSSSSTFTRNYPCLRFVRRRGSQKNLQSARISSNEWKFRSCKQNFAPVYSLPVVRGQAEIKISRFSFFFFLLISIEQSLVSSTEILESKGNKTRIIKVLKSREKDLKISVLFHEKQSSRIIYAQTKFVALSRSIWTTQPFSHFRGARSNLAPRNYEAKRSACARAICHRSPPCSNIRANLLLITSFHDRDRIHDKRTIGSREISKDLRKRMEKKWGVVVEGESGGMRTQLEKRDGK